jgi:hypothetical protein
MTDGSEALVTVHTPMRLMMTPGGGPPAHSNDYDELWFLHSTEVPAIRSETLGKLRWDPQGLTQPGAVRRQDQPAASRPADIAVMNVNIDVRQRLRVTAEALLADQDMQVEEGAAAGD